MNRENANRPEIEELFRAQRDRLWGLAYRLTGSAADADDVVQESFARLLAKADAVTTPASWLVRVATNLGIDAIRRRKRSAYAGPWLPAPIETPDGQPPGLPQAEERDPESRYGMAESATYAFLVALEALSPRQRAALLLRDVVGISARETADLLDTSEGNVRILHLRARRALEEYDRNRSIPTEETRARHRDALKRFLDCLLAQDAEGLEELLAESVQTLTDSGGEYTALPTPLLGRDRVARLYLAAALHRQEGGVSQEIRLVNSMPAALVTLTRPARRQAPRSLLRVELDDEGRIGLIHAVLAPEKLVAMAPA